MRKATLFLLAVIIYVVQADRNVNPTRQTGKTPQADEKTNSPKNANEHSLQKLAQESLQKGQQWLSKNSLNDFAEKNLQKSQQWLKKHPLEASARKYKAKFVKEAQEFIVKHPSVLNYKKKFAQETAKFLDKHPIAAEYKKKLEKNIQEWKSSNAGKKLKEVLTKPDDAARGFLEKSQNWLKTHSLDDFAKKHIQKDQQWLEKHSLDEMAAKYKETFANIKAELIAKHPELLKLIQKFAQKKGRNNS